MSALSSRVDALLLEVEVLQERVRTLELHVERLESDVPAPDSTDCRPYLGRLEVGE